MLHKIFLLLLAILPAIATAQQAVKFDRSFHYRTTEADSENIRNYLVKDSVVEIKDYRKGKLYRSGTFYGFKSLTDLDEFIWFKYNGHYTKHRDLDITNKSGYATYYNEKEKPDQEYYYVGDKTYVLQLWKDGQPMLVSGSGIRENYDPETGERSRRIVKDSLVVEDYSFRPSKGDTIYHLVDTHSYPKEGLARFSNELARTIEYPKISKFLGIGKKITIVFVVDENGKLTEFVPVSERAFAFEKKAIAKLEKMPAWNPATFRGRNVKTRFRVPITFVVE